ncbi:MULTISPECIES: 2-dehydro-3-deoxygalactonokinase [Rhizobium]|uniref:2-dehydro-3-deoxygalactonokinase n=1 Tax=Rhizobium tropici TaxID=398 RepID=A0A329YCW4_RHITR|nr:MULTISPECIES: 2-dehydro-3-deoxygalactonokinase [Rhizobium]MBB3288598.1 2-dehydro-3-deoxygalactonokinase [Rhizobium sp. BK252]MBB3403265.1 2-dehydro-3-deoxygalactonokinase [Rhizobium sp. BK289]MBB3415840.1 2-dehydro-3-deoxygalactonokinase [Rhizobium sp. BK284]MBB3483728.1 2-dehydro-3-deoxygalactonokinase [Rhizobium sp. BK347]MDK4722293.1 2-dehydro-3-deoxygalactonokinase [Rhizobium sp. CNPSo 3968]
MTKPAYVAVDWGTSSFRLWLIGDDGSILAERRSGEGMTTAAQAGFAKVLQVHLDAVSAPDTIPVLVCGMAGARQGWVEAGYIDTPASLAAILTGAVSVPGQSRDIRILPGLAQRSRQAPDVMRGEETQLLGTIAADVRGEQLVCMPGTHSKWVRVLDGQVTGFSTFMTGELFDVITKHSILSHAVAGAADQPADTKAFETALRTAFDKPALATNLLFTARSGQLLHGLTATGAQALISGTLIGAEIAGALASAAQNAAITLVASGRLQALYEDAFRALSLTYKTIDADAAVRRGLSAAAEAIWFKKESKS